MCVLFPCILLNESTLNFEYIFVEDGTFVRTLIRINTYSKIIKNRSIIRLLDSIYLLVLITSLSYFFFYLSLYLFFFLLFSLCFCFCYTKDTNNSRRLDYRKIYERIRALFLYIRYTHSYESQTRITNVGYLKNLDLVTRIKAAFVSLEFVSTIDRAPVPFEKITR